MNGNVNRAFQRSDKMESELYSQVPPLPPRFRLRDLILGDSLFTDHDRYCFKSYLQKILFFFILLLVN